MGEQTKLERLKERIASWIARVLPMRVKRHVLVDLAIALREKKPEGAMFDFTFEELFP